jgi:hypothetical protein
MADVFISYSRADQAFVKVLHQALTRSQYDAWVDWEDIPLTADWWREIQTGIEAADTFVFIISPDSLASKVCHQEIEYAAANHKRLMPIVRRDGFDRSNVPPDLGRHNWLYFRETDDFKAAFQALVTALDTDLDYVKFHTRLLVRAKEWQTQGHTEDYLLRGDDLDTTETWLSQSAGKSPSPIALQQEFVYRSRQAATVRQRQAQRRLQIYGGSVSVFALAALAAAGVALHQRQNARRQEQLAYQQSKLAFAHQLAVEGQASTQSQILSQKESMEDTRETALAFGLDSLPQDLADILATENPRQITFSPEQTFVAVISDAFDLRVWHLATARTVLAWGTGEPNVVDIGFSPDESLVAVATQDGVLHIWQTDLEAYVKKAGIPVHAAGLTDTAFSPDGSLLATASADGTFNIWAMQEILNIRDRQVAQARLGEAIQSLTFSPDGQVLMTGSDDTTVRAWSLRNEPLLCIRHEDAVRLVQFNQDGTQFGSVSGNTTVRVWPWPLLLEAGRSLAGETADCGY